MSSNYWNILSLGDDNISTKHEGNALRRQLTKPRIANSEYIFVGSTLIGKY